MQIALTKKLADAMKLKPSQTIDNENPLFSWTANWTNTFDGRKEDMIIMVNHATRFTISIYGVKRNQFKDIKTKMAEAIRNTFGAMNINPEIIDEYMKQAGEIEFCINKDRKLTSWVNHQGLAAAFAVGRFVNDSRGVIKFNDTLGYFVSRETVSHSKSHSDYYVPAEEMTKALSNLASKPMYKYRAFELVITLDLEIYKATRQVVVPAHIELSSLHNLIQRLFRWKNYHLHDFKIIDKKSGKSIERIVMSEEDLVYDPNAILERDKRLSDYFPKHNKILYTYDFGDNWQHTIELLNVIEEYNEDSPYLLKAVGQGPPEDVGGVGGFIDFREIMLNPNHPDYDETKEWAQFWSPELSEWESKPKIIHFE